MPACRLHAAVFLLATFDLLAAAAPQAFVDVTAGAGLTTQYMPDFVNELQVQTQQGGGVTVFDADGDGWDDIYWMGGALQPCRLYVNQGDGSFQLATGTGLEIAAPLSMAAFADYDDDGDFDLFAPTYTSFVYQGQTVGSKVFLLRNDGGLAFTDVTAGSGLEQGIAHVWGASWGDLDGDGLLDLVTVANWHPGSTPQESSHRMWQNLGDGTFANRTLPEVVADGVHGYAPILVDYDDDGDQDVLSANDHLTSRVYRNDGGWRFTRVDQTILEGGPLTDTQGMGASVSDFNHDGVLDWYVTSILWEDYIPIWGASTGNRLYLGAGDGTFVDGTRDYGLLDGGWGWGAQILDIHNDTLLDAANANGWYTLLASPPILELHFDTLRIFVQDGGGTCTDDSAALGVVDIDQGRGLVAFDYDRDGLQDLLVSNNNAGMTLYRATHPAPGRFLQVRLAGTLSNRHGIGAKVTASHPALPTQTRWITHGSNYVSQSPPEAWFGLGGVTGKVTVRVDWPSGMTSFHKLAPDQHVVLQEPAFGFGAPQVKHR